MATFKANFLEQNGAFHANFGQTSFVHTDNYKDLYNLPSIEGVTLIDDKTFKQLGLDHATEAEIEQILYLN